MASLRTRKKVLLVKQETTEGTYAAPSASTDAVKVENLRWSPATRLIDTNEHTGVLDKSAPIVGGTSINVSFDVPMKGSGTAGTAPEWGKLLKALGFAEVVTSATPGSPEACANGGSTTLAILGSSASTTAQAYRGMPLAITGTGAGNTFITNYTTSKNATLADTMGASIVNSSNWQIPANVLYKPASTDIPSFSFDIYEDGTYLKLNGCRGTGSLRVAAGEIGRLSFNFTGRVEGSGDDALPLPSYDPGSAPLFINARATYDRAQVAIADLSLDWGNKLTNPDNPNAVEGFDPSEITERELTGSINPKMVLRATRDVFTDFRGNTRKIIHARWGSTAGNRLGVVIPAAQPMDYGMDDRSGIAAESYRFFCSGDEAGAFLCVY